MTLLSHALSFAIYCIPGKCVEHIFSFMIAFAVIGIALSFFDNNKE